MRLAFIDTETTGADERQHDAWEVAVVVDDGKGTLVGADSWMMTPDVQAADAKALEIGGFYSRIQTGKVSSPLFVVGGVVHRTVDAMFASCNVSFDTRFVSKLLYQHGRRPPWHYSPLDVKSFALGALMRMGVEIAPGAKTGEIAQQLGIDYDFEAPHNALDDAHLARAIYWRALACTWPRGVEPSVAIPKDILV